MGASSKIALLTLLALAACSEQPSQNRYDSRDVGMNANVVFGTILSERQVQVSAANSGVGTLAGGAGGGVAGSLIGAGKGSTLGVLGGAVAGALLGNQTEKSMGNRTGIEYIVALDTGINQSIVQNIAQDDKALPVGSRIMVQTQGSYRRVLPAPPNAPRAPGNMPVAQPAAPASFVP